MQHTRKNGAPTQTHGPSMFHTLGFAALALLGLAAAPTALAQTYTLNTLAIFNGENGQDSNANLTLSGSTLYGTTIHGGILGSGEVFSVPVTGGTPTVLASFTGANGQYPYANLTLSGNTLYGTTYSGGRMAKGKYFRCQRRAVRLPSSPVSTTQTEERP